MASVVEELKPTLASLSEHDRAELAHFLLHSLDEPDDQISPEEWTEVLDRRWAEITSGKESGIPVDVLSARLREMYP